MWVKFTGFWKRVKFFTPTINVKKNNRNPLKARCFPRRCMINLNAWIGPTIWYNLQSWRLFLANYSEMCSELWRKLRKLSFISNLPDWRLRWEFVRKVQGRSLRCNQPIHSLYEQLMSKVQTLSIASKCVGPVCFIVLLIQYKYFRNVINLFMLFP